MVTHADLVDAFGKLWVKTMNADTAAEIVTDPGARRVLTEVGLPLSMMDIMHFGDIAKSPPGTLGRLLFSSPPVGRANDLVIGNGLGGLVCLSLADGSLYWYKTGDPNTFALVNSDLDRYVTILHRVWQRLDALIAEYHDEDEVPSPDEDADAIVAEIRDLDPPSFDSPVRYWQTMIVEGLETMLDE